MKIQLLRNATLVIKANNQTLLVDPMLAAKGSYNAFPGTPGNQRNPTIDLPVSQEELAAIVSQTDAVLLTHIHLDHWDTAAQQLVPKHVPILCQNEDEAAIKATGFSNVLPVHNEVVWHGIRIIRTNGQHGTGEIGRRMGTVSGYIIDDGKQVVYIAGDTIWCNDVKDTIDKYQPNHIIVNGGAARFLQGDPIVMNIPDIISVCGYTAGAKIYVAHLEAVNHGTENRAAIALALHQHNLTNRCFVPNDGDVFLR
ncbi:MBL fold metallo-hydrolase [Mucilaginibacter sp. Bleaf8]|uniref:MBL fold metallo-hydrolase n=1 Tax=Mucilaginibacter sp. Bleaf8 TaxID=2834430 RepID=UPI001BCE9823|nr:MBL fold metallo-hydrolase [Mucilaginibacter sp. Bleaf8]MBS7562866.1 MBL fold metallo-hydrolase [Mucilaginibacter sp. Bleaf8]